MLSDRKQRIDPRQLNRRAAGRRILLLALVDLYKRLANVRDGENRRSAVGCVMPFGCAARLRHLPDRVVGRSAATNGRSTYRCRSLTLGTQDCRPPGHYHWAVHSVQ